MTEHLSNTELKRLHRQWRKKTDYRVSLIIDGVQGPYNIGSIIRSAAAKRVNSIWFASGATTPSNVKTGKTALGSERYVSWFESSDAMESIEAARAEGYMVVGLELASNAVPIHDLDLKNDICFVVVVCAFSYYRSLGSCRKLHILEWRHMKAVKVLR